MSDLKTTNAEIISKQLTEQPAILFTCMRGKNNELVIVISPYIEEQMARTILKNLKEHLDNGVANIYRPEATS